MENTRPHFDGSAENGVQSKALDVDDGSRTLRVGPVVKSCPIDMVEETPSSTSFLQLSSRIKESPPRPDDTAVAEIPKPADKQGRPIQLHSDLPTDKAEDDISSFLQLTVAEAPIQLTEPVTLHNLVSYH